MPHSSPAYLFSAGWNLYLDVQGRGTRLLLLFIAYSFESILYCRQCFSSKWGFIAMFNVLFSSTRAILHSRNTRLDFLAPSVDGTRFPRWLRERVGFQGGCPGFLFEQGDWRLDSTRHVSGLEVALAFLSVSWTTFSQLPGRRRSHHIPRS
jgi:hypothetical protein